jgi:hypothetical protein
MMAATTRDTQGPTSTAKGFRVPLAASPRKSPDDEVASLTPCGPAYKRPAPPTVPSGFPES